MQLLGAKKATSGMFPVMLDNIVASEFLGVLAGSFSAESLQKGKSMFADRLGKVVCSPLITILDDALLPGGAGSRAFDDEGMPSRTTPLMVEGRLEGFLHNAYTAKKAGCTSTGNGSRGGFRSLPGVGSTNLYIKNGDVSPKDLIASVKSGLLVKEVLGMHTANPISGDFSVGVSGLWIEGGKVSHPVREAAISGNVLTMFSEVDAVGDDLRMVGGIGAPSILLRPVSVSGS
ncbi:MAG: TldD/PmbA family protein [Nitrospirae bacterium]|nr:TldD/PmbA family protein [Nitrospirota bacterium]